ncbi:FG-GAP repeat domain-containing protein [Streptomyces lancefieldiae]|uniref:VCBS repeat-containing protein n=1 Tax=Streptomyces lancefieldiae TaxID=3075520 RepID=A0ABU3AU07_9ACTN|nr:VCBS repeat-containing protein [Streptomyces sp. DSM 40712]MDT0613661.1 VCBS repeat-containing protein [Streptomyces sp. DSM 40712]
MSHVRPSRRRLAVAVTAVLAVTAGLTGMTVQAQAAPSATAPATAPRLASESVVPFPAGRRIVGVTESGYLTKDPSVTAHSWVRASDGAVTELPDDLAVASTGAGDLVAMSNGSEAWLEDVSTGEQPVRIRLRTGGGTGVYEGAAGRALFSTVSRADGGIDLRMHTADDATSTVAAFPPGVHAVSVSAGTSAHALLTYRTPAGEIGAPWALIDLATGTITETGRREYLGSEGVAVSSTHVVWVEHRPTGISAVVRTRATGEQHRIPLGEGWVGNLRIGLQGDYLVYGLPNGLTAQTSDPMFALTAHNLRTGTETKLLDHVTSLATAPNGVLHVRGGTVAHGEGLYRIAPGTGGGAPSASLVASTGEPTGLALVGHDVPEVIDLSRGGSGRNLTWTLSRKNAIPTATLRHVRTGKTAKLRLTRSESSSYTSRWSGDLDGSPVTAYNGDYVWEFSASPVNGIGPTLTASGTFKVVRSPAAPHDFNDNGSPDVLARDTSGRLWRSDSRFVVWDDSGSQLTEGENKLLGGGWNAYDQIEATGNIGGATTGDLVARDKAGVLWIYLGKGDGTFTTRARIGAGWNIYDKIAAGSDLTNDGRPDLLATDKSGVLWLYKGTGDWRAPFAARARIGAGWDIYNQLTATGDIGGAASGDLVARDKAGVLWIYLGKGDGTFATRTRIGGGWNAYLETVGIGDANHDGHPDLIAYTGSYGTYFYAGTGNWRTPFVGRQGAALLRTNPNPPYTAIS